MIPALTNLRLPDRRGSHTGFILTEQPLGTWSQAWNTNSVTATDKCTPQNTKVQ